MYKIAIIGAGPAGCLLARLLLSANINVTVFESNPEPRPDGGTLDLHTDTGLAALKKAGLYPEFQKKCRYDGESFQIADKRAVHLLNLGGTSKESSRGRPEIDRPVLVHMLADSLPSGVIQFSHKLRSIDDDLTLRFDEQSISGFDLVVGADGAWSKSRKFLSDVQPYYSGISGYECSIPDARKNEPDLAAFVRSGSLFTFSDQKAVMAQQMGDGSIKSAAWVRQRDPTGPSGAQATEHVRGLFADWSPRITRAVQTPHMKPMTFRALYMLPIGFRWHHRRGVTLIGDAAHLMTPFAGEGVNAAMKDAMELAEHIIAASKTADAAVALDRRIELAEEELFVRAERIQRHTWDMTTAAFHDAGMPWSNIEKYVLTAAADDMPAIMWPVVVVLAYAYFYVIRLMRAPPKPAHKA